MQPFPPGTDLHGLVDAWRREREQRFTPYTHILLRRIYCDLEHPLPEGGSLMAYRAVHEARRQCMREREGYVAPRVAPPSRRFAGFSAYAAGPQRLNWFCCRECKRPIARAIYSVRGDLPRVVFCECGDDSAAIERMNAELFGEDVASRDYWRSLDSGAGS